MQCASGLTLKLANDDFHALPTLHKVLREPVVHSKGSTGNIEVIQSQARGKGVANEHICIYRGIRP